MGFKIVNHSLKVVIFMFPMDTVMPVYTNIHQMGNYYSHGENLEQIRDSLILYIIFVLTRMVGYMLQTEKTIGCRCLAQMANTKPNG